MVRMGEETNYSKGKSVKSELEVFYRMNSWVLNVRMDILYKFKKIQPFNLSQTLVLKESIST